MSNNFYNVETTFWSNAHLVLFKIFNVGSMQRQGGYGFMADLGNPVKVPLFEPIERQQIKASNCPVSVGLTVVDWQNPRLIYC